MLQIVKEIKNCYHDYLVFILRGSFCMSMVSAHSISLLKRMLAFEENFVVVAFNTGPPLNMTKDGILDKLLFELNIVSTCI
jgi:hypothetical protein